MKGEREEEKKTNEEREEEKKRRPGIEVMGRQREEPAVKSIYFCRTLCY